MERRRAMLNEGAARDAVVVEEAFRFDLILDVRRRQESALFRAAEQSADAVSNRVALDMASVRFPHNVRRRQQRVLCGEDGDAEASIFVVPRKELKAAAAAELLVVEDAERVGRQQVWTEWLDGHSGLIVALTRTIEGS